MTLFIKTSGTFIISLLLISCDRQNEETTDDKSVEEPTSGISSRNLSPSRVDERKESPSDKTAKVLAKLRGATDKNLKRDLFEKVILELPPEDHDLAVEAVIDDLNSDDPANLVVDYLEFSSLMSPALQLPGMVRLLEEQALLPLQRVAMEQQLREELGVSADQTVKNWRPLVEEHLSKNKSLISEE